jgi:hypothetical protein
MLPSMFKREAQMGRGISRGLVVFFAGLLAGLSAGVGVNAFSGEETPLRIEALAGHCKHRLGPDSSWHYQYGGYQTNMDMTPNCIQAGLSYLPFKYRDLRLGFRVAYVDLGDIKAHNTFPVDEKEYFRAREAGEPVNSATARYQGQGGARGLTLGLASEYPVGPFKIGPEAGAAFLYARWSVMVADGVQDISPGCRYDWSCANGWKVTPYFGVTARYEWLEVSFRRYANVHASRTERRDYFIGPYTGPVDSVMVGISIPL